MIDPGTVRTASELVPSLERFWTVSATALDQLTDNWSTESGAPVYTVGGRYTSRGWTEWTQGFQFGSALLQFDATGEARFLESGRANTLAHMPPHLTHVGVHDHGFNNMSTYGNLRRLMLEERLPFDQREMELYELAIKVSGAVQASRWSKTAYGSGYIHSFNGPQSLFSDTLRSLRILGLAHQLGHVLMSEGDERVSLLGRLIEHADTTALFNAYYGDGRDSFDVRGRVAHESIFNVADGQYRCPSTQQGYSPFSTWTRGLAWILCGYAEQLEFFAHLKASEVEPFGSKRSIVQRMEKAARATADFYLENSFADGVPFWDTGAPGTVAFGRIASRPSDPHNDVEPLDSSAAAICAQGYLRLGNYLMNKRKDAEGKRYRAAGLTIADALLDRPYLSTDPKHQGLLLHAIYHQPNGWDYIPRGRKIPCGESAMWGDYHLMELAMLIKREAEGAVYPTFFR